MKAPAELIYTTREWYLIFFRSLEQFLEDFQISLVE